MSINRRDLLLGVATATAAAGLGGSAQAAMQGSADCRKLPDGPAERHKRIVREKREASQMRVLPSALPESGAFELQTPLGGLEPRIITTAVDSPAKSMAPADFMAIAAGFPSQALGPTFISYGPMMAEGDVVIEEWESFIYGANGTLYNNQYCWILRFEGDEVVEMREYNDSHHAALIFGPLGKWPELKPSVAPRRRSRKGEPVPEPAPAALETVFKVVDKFEMDPRMFADVVPTAEPAPVETGPGPEGNKALVRALRQARATGDRFRVNRFFAEGYRHFIAGERPFGWDRLPLEEIYAPLVEHIASPLQVRYGPVIADGNRVFEEMDVFARLDDGTVYNNWHAIFHEIRDGKIVQTREYTDTRHMWVALGRWAPWGQVPVEPRSTPRRSNLQSIAMTAQTPTFFLDLERWRPFPQSPR